MKINELSIKIVNAIYFATGNFELWIDVKINDQTFKFVYEKEKNINKMRLKKYSSGLINFVKSLYPTATSKKTESFSRFEATLFAAMKHLSQFELSEIQQGV